MPGIAWPCHDLAAKCLEVCTRTLWLWERDGRLRAKLISGRKGPPVKWLSSEDGVEKLERERDAWLKAFASIPDVARNGLAETSGMAALFHGSVDDPYVSARTAAQLLGRDECSLSNWEKPGACPYIPTRQLIPKTFRGHRLAEKGERGRDIKGYRLADLVEIHKVDKSYADDAYDFPEGRRLTLGRAARQSFLSHAFIRTRLSRVLPVSSRAGGSHANASGLSCAGPRERTVLESDLVRLEAGIRAAIASQDLREEWTTSDDLERRYRLRTASEIVWLGHILRELRDENLISAQSVLLLSPRAPRLC